MRSAGPAIAASATTVVLSLLTLLAAMLTTNRSLGVAGAAAPGRHGGAGPTGPGRVEAAGGLTRPGVRQRWRPAPVVSCCGHS
ncbi:hypothetical protein ABGB07_19845 [Micromonosporaceae bacterium B7E4]